MAEDIALEQPDRNEQVQRRQLNQLKYQASKARDEVVEKLKKEAVLVVKRVTLRFINSACAATIVGLIVTYIIMSFQATIGNFFNSKLIPKLSFMELFIWAALTGLIILIVPSALGLSAIITLPMTDPVAAVGVTFELVKELWGI